MKVSNLLKNVELLAKRNSPAILTGFGVAGVATTAYLASKAGYRASEDIRNEEIARQDDLDMRERVELCWRLYVPTVASATLTVAAVIGANRVANSRTVAATAAYTLSERAFDEYRDKMVDILGERKEQTARDEIAKEKLDENPPSNAQLVIAGPGNVLCCELYTMRYFHSDMDTLRKAENEINSRIIQAMYVTLDDLYDILGLEHTSDSDKLGWDSDRLMGMNFSTQLSTDGVPCLAFEYNYVKPI